MRPKNEWPENIGRQQTSSLVIPLVSKCLRLYGHGSRCVALKKSESYQHNLHLFLPINVPILQSTLIFDDQTPLSFDIIYTIWLFNKAMENHNF